MFFLNMVDYPVFFPTLSTLTWDTFLTLRGPWGFYLNHVLPLTPYKSCGWVGGGGVGWWWWGYTPVYTTKDMIVIS